MTNATVEAGTSNKAAWKHDDKRPDEIQGNVFGVRVGVRIQDWELGEGKSVKATLEIFEHDPGEGDEGDLLATYEGKIERLKKKGKKEQGFRFTDATFTRVEAGTGSGAGKVELVRNAFLVYLVDPKQKAKSIKPESVHILGDPDEDEAKSYELSFRIKVDGVTKVTCQDRLQLIADTEGCELRIPVMGQAKPGWKKGSSTKGGISSKRPKEHKKNTNFFDYGKDPIKYDYAAVYAEWTACTRKVPFLDTSLAPLQAGDWSADGEDMLTIAEAIERGVVVKVSDELAAGDAAGDAVTDAIDAATGGDADEEAEGEPEAAEEEIDTTLLNLNAYDHVLNPAHFDDFKDVSIVETIEHGGCNLTCVSLAFWYLGVFDKVLAGIAEEDKSKKALFPHYCGKAKSDEYKIHGNSRRPCKARAAKAANVCGDCDHRKMDSNVPVDAMGRRQLPPLWFNAWLWWFILAHQAPQGYSRGKKSKYTDDRGNFSFFSLVDALGTQLGLGWEARMVTFGDRNTKKSGTIPAKAIVKPDEVEVHGRRVRGILRKGLPLVVSLRFKNHINLIIGCKRIADGSWRYLFLDPGGKGGWKVWSKLERAQRYSAFKRLKTEGWEPEWVKPNAGDAGIVGAEAGND